MLLTHENIWEAIDHLKEFVPWDISRIYYLGSTKARVREWVQSSLNERIKAGTCEEMGFGEDLGRRFLLIPPTNLTLPPGAKRPRDSELEHESVS